MEEKKWYETKVKYDNVGAAPDDVINMETVCLVKAISFADAEAEAVDYVIKKSEADGYHATEIEAKACSIRKYAEIIHPKGVIEGEHGQYYKCSVLVDVDGSLRMKPESSLVEAPTFLSAAQLLNDHYSHGVCDYEIVTVQKTPIKCVLEQ